VSYNRQLATKNTSLTADSRSAQVQNLDTQTLEPLNHKKSGTFLGQAQPPINTEIMNSAQRAILA